jgi:hypothetical protein
MTDLKMYRFSIVTKMYRYSIVTYTCMSCEEEEDTYT